MNNYEILYILSDKQDADGKKALVERFKALVAPYGEVTAEEWGGGSRKLEYPIQTKISGKHLTGYYVLMKFTALDLHVVVATAIASLIIGVLAVVVSSRTKVPAEACLYPSLLPMFPGIYAYRTFGALVMCLYKGSEGAFNHYFYLFASNGFTCFFILLAMVAGATIPLFAMKRISFQVTRRGHTPVL